MSFQTDIGNTLNVSFFNSDVQSQMKQNQCIQVRANSDACLLAGGGG